MHRGELVHLTMIRLFLLYLLADLIVTFAGFVYVVFAAQGEDVYVLPSAFKYVATLYLYFVAEASLVILYDFASEFAIVFMASYFFFE